MNIKKIKLLIHEHSCKILYIHEPQQSIEHEMRARKIGLTPL